MHGLGFPPFSIDVTQLILCFSRNWYQWKLLLCRINNFCTQNVNFILWRVNIYFGTQKGLYLFCQSANVYFCKKLISNIFQCPKCTYQTTEGSSGTRHCPKRTYQTTEGSGGTESISLISLFWLANREGKSTFFFLFL